MNTRAHFIPSNQCGGGRPNNVYGSGRVDLLPLTEGSLQCPNCWQPFAFPLENFDEVMPPTLPLGWVAANAQGPPPLWVTSDAGVPLPVADTPPNATFVDDPAVVSDKRLDSPAVFGFGKFIFYRLTFRQNFNFEASSEDPNLGFDGGVLELSTDGGSTFQYIPPSAFVLGGYNRTISTDRGSPIGGLRAWSGNSEGYITTVVDIESPLPGSGKVRWRMASDTSGSNEGWRIDTLNVTGCHGQGTPCPSPTPTPTPTVRPTPTPRPRPTPAPRP